ncbi:MAG: hypothetical protein OEW83_18950 [Acidimicrobiia bacterium]|nr:hypothetical protein [Acidimicrobiia bacterium]
MAQPRLTVRTSTPAITHLVAAEWRGPMECEPVHARSLNGRLKDSSPES